MKAFEFETKLTSDQMLTLPTDLKKELPPGSPVRVILLLPDSTEELDWRRLTTEQFARAYAEADSVYDNL